MEESRFDRVLKILERRGARFVSEKVDKDLGNVKPFDKEPVSEREQLLNYEGIAPEVKQAYQQQDPMGFVNIEEQMAKLRRKYGG